MNIKSLFALLLIAFFSFSCSNRDEEPITSTEYNPLVTKIDIGVFAFGIPLNNPFAYYFEYDNAEKLTKKIGGFLALSGGTGYSGFYSNEIYTSLVYTDDKVTVEDFSSSSQFTVPKKTKYFKLNSTNVVLEKEIPEPQSAYRYKKQFYTYKNGLLDEIKTTLPNMPYDPTDPNDYIITYSEKFFYDGSNNLIRAEYYELHNGIKEGEKIIRTFGSYDNSYNPFKRFTLLDEFFYRSISKNNFRSYKEEKTYYGNTNISNQEWTFNYDTNANIIIN